MINKLTIDITKVKTYIHCYPIFPTYNYTIHLNATDILIKLKSNDRSNFLESIDLNPHFKVLPNDVDAFGVYITSDTPAEYKIRFILHTIDSKIIKSNWIEISIY